MKIFTLVKRANPPLHHSPLVFVHGSWGSSAMWMQYSEFFKNKGWDIYAVDLRGHGKSEGTVAGATMNDYVADVKKAVDDHGLSHPILIGHSMGGLVAMMYAATYGAAGLVAIDPSPTREMQGEGEEKVFPETYTPMDAGMPTDPMEVMKAFPDLSPEMLMNMKAMLGAESGVARSERKRGISVPTSALSMPTLFVGGELGESVPFGIGIATAHAMGALYTKEVFEVKGATHPGILLGKHALKSAQSIEAWLSKNSTPPTT